MITWPTLTNTRWLHNDQGLAPKTSAQCQLECVFIYKSMPKPVPSQLSHRQLFRLSPSGSCPRDLSCQGPAEHRSWQVVGSPSFI